MTEGMFKDTMVNMNWTEIKSYSDTNALVLIPLGVIEEHGPHLCLGTDIYIAHIQSIFIKKLLEQEGQRVVIAPPFYWGVCQATGSFIGSFRIKKETARDLLYDIIRSLIEFGFKNIYGINAHGDIEHSVAMIDVFKKISEDYSINCRYTFYKDVMHHYGLNGTEAFICPITPQKIKINTSEYQDVHAGDIETAIMHQFYPDLTDINKAASLPPVSLDNEKIMTWLYGGHTESLSPGGYLGSPADFGTVEVLKHLNNLASGISTAIIESMSTE
ncbi:MAG: creatininase family protein [Spirochaetales bacterium]|nr:creatininase family protein [Spirochaetales bacterium]